MTKDYYKVWQVLKSVTVITKWDRKLLQSVAGITNVTENYYKVWQILQSVTVNTKWDRTLVKCVTENFYKVWQVLQIVTRNYYSVTYITTTIANCKMRRNRELALNWYLIT